MGDTFNFNGSIGQFVKEGDGIIQEYHAQSMAASSSVTNTEETQDNQNNQHSKQENRIPLSLATDRAKAEFGKLQKAGLLDESLQPIHLTRPQMGCIVIRMGAVLGLASQWKDFGQLWEVDPELLRTQFVKGQETGPTQEFNRKLQDI